MSNRTKQRRSGGLTLLLFQRPPHPEFFHILRTDRVVRRLYEADIWLVEGGHVICFTAAGNTLAEVIMFGGEVQTDRGLIQTVPCRGEKYHEMTVPGGNIKYMISTQEEQLSQPLFQATRHEIASYAARRELLMAEKSANGESGSMLSVLDVERRSHELLIQSFHLFEDSQMVIKTQGIFEVVRPAQ